MATLYRKYRPQAFADVVGQEHVTQTLINQIKHDQVAHAYLFAGPRGVGKTTTARLLAQAVQAHDKKSGEPDEKNVVVQAMRDGKSLDVVEIDAASNRRIEEVRELREHVKYPPNQGKYKVFIIDEVHMLTPEAFNALLKTLEEPPAYVIFILATTELHKLPDTIISRCQRFDFSPVKPTVLQKRLETLCTKEGIAVDEAVLHTIVKLSGGCVRDAEGYLGQVVSLGGKKITAEDAAVVLPAVASTWVFALWESLLADDQAKSMTTIQEAYEAGVDIPLLFDDCIELFRHVLLWRVQPKTTAPVYVLTHEQIPTVREQSSSLSVRVIQECINILLEHKQHIPYSPVTVLPLEIAFVLLHELLRNNSETPTPTAQENQQTTTSAKSQIKQSPQETVVHNTEIWNPVLEALQQENPALAQYLASAVVQQKGNKLHITVGHSFHYEIAKKQNSIALLEQILEQKAQKKYGVVIALDDALSKQQNVDDTHIQDLADSFGGQIVSD